ncbi:hypothetical protein [Arthrobacter sp. UYCu712]|uniref:hypothetical protein n=1 Tax=Arthrobacter sp. UYCu712 TaxID=3156340 RepID=UPI0033912538
MQIEITDVFLRDGLQDIDVVVPTARKLETAARLIAAGVRRLEIASSSTRRRCHKWPTTKHSSPGCPSATTWPTRPWP